MATFLFLSGADCGDVDAITMFGVAFTRGEPVEVDDAFIVAKLRGNRFFLELDGEQPATDAEAPRRRGRPRKDA